MADHVDLQQRPRRALPQLVVGAHRDLEEELSPRAFDVEIPGMRLRAERLERLRAGSQQMLVDPDVALCGIIRVLAR